MFAIKGRMGLGDVDPAGERFTFGLFVTFADGRDGTRSLRWLFDYLHSERRVEQWAAGGQDLILSANTERLLALVDLDECERRARSWRAANPNQ